MSYCELTLTERSTLQVALAQQMSFRAIARLLKRAPSTISREVRRHARFRQHYQANKVQGNRHYRRLLCRPKRKRLPSTERFELITHMLKKYLSPKQIAGQSKTMDIPSLRDAYVCKETIYTAIYALPVGQLRHELIHGLRHGRNQRKP